MFSAFGKFDSLAELDEILWGVDRRIKIVHDHSTLPRSRDGELGNIHELIYWERLVITVWRELLQQLVDFDQSGNEFTYWKFTRLAQETTHVAFLHGESSGWKYVGG
jgi:hypothetical protein